MWLHQTHTMHFMSCLMISGKYATWISSLVIPAIFACLCCSVQCGNLSVVIANANEMRLMPCTVTL